MDQEGDPCEVKKASLKPTTPTAEDPNSISPLGSDQSLSEEELLTDEEIIESIYQNLFQAILVLRLQQCSAETWCDEDCQTPPPSRVTEMVSDTCPGAPVQSTKTWRNDGSGRAKRLFF
ncbi:unnamed protein product [Eruca vesicaria subsp. sativa]|uniref:Uncharacterized protein n=1 Tax=Eruca vesicaria subsp. sativa TaxID=29727 RepID=A0ABC8LQJ5_ERUVS|nr:unnamed protein product [Eruca vesicaria subsp. sativa]